MGQGENDRHLSHETGRRVIFAFSPPGRAMLIFVDWATVTVIDKHGQRHSVDVKAESTYDAAHLYFCHAKSARAALLPSAPPVPTVATTFEVSVNGKLYHVRGADLRMWIKKRREQLNGPKGLLFRERPVLE
jgi:hypothetical protein